MSDKLQETNMRVATLYKNSAKPVVSLEFFPPRDDTAAEKFDKTLDDLSVINPDYMTMTFGAGGSTREGSYQTVKNMVVRKNLPTVAYLAGFGLGPDDIREVLDSYKALGVETIFVVRGDEPRDVEFTPHPDSFSYASEMIAFIKKQYDFTLGCAGYPEGHIQAQSLEKDIEYLKLKVDNGAEYVVCQYCYDTTYYFDFIDKCRAAGINVPIIPGIMPVYTIKMTKMLSKICGTTLTEDLKARLAELESASPQDVIAYGIDVAVDQCRDFLKYGVQGLHFYTMNRSKSTTEIVQRLREEKLL
jgi:methylenetetrahydrofolate reductase (NADPH)